MMTDDELMRMTQQNTAEVTDRMTPRRQTWRVYFNCRDHFPFLAAVDNGTIASQIRVQWVRMEHVDFIQGQTDMGMKPAEMKPGNFYPEDTCTREAWRVARKGKHNEPTWWMEFDAIAVFGGGGVTFYGERG